MKKNWVLNNLDDPWNVFLKLKNFDWESLIFLSKIRKKNTKTNGTNT